MTDEDKQYFKPGDWVMSGGGSYYYKIQSYPFSRLYLDFKGKYQSEPWSRIKKEDLDDEHTEFLLGFLDLSKKIITGPDELKLASILIFYILLQLKIKPFLCLSLTGQFTQDLSNSQWQIDGKGKWSKSLYYPASYMAKCCDCMSPCSHSWLHQVTIPLFIAVRYFDGTLKVIHY